MAEIELVRLLLAAAMLAVASFVDLRRRSVNDSLWIIFGIAGALVYIFGFPSLGNTGGSLNVTQVSFGAMLPVIFSISITSAISYGIYRTGLFGGADALGLIVFSVIMPVYTGSGLISIINPDFRSVVIHPFAPIIVLTNAVIISLSQVAANLVRNAIYIRKKPGRLFAGLESEPLPRKMMAAIIGYRSEGQPRYSFPIEKVVDGSREFDFTIKPAETADYATKKDTWVSPGIPFIVYLAAGFVVMITAGDLMALLMGAIMPN
jgi:preflagellin peptidase FlaK